LIEQLLPFIQPYARELLGRYASLGAQPTSAYRSRREQFYLYQMYLKRGRQGTPVAPPGYSMHERRRAIDIEARPEILREMGELWEYWGGHWGGRFGDPIHFEA
jgi:hypothetical protein